MKKHFPMIIVNVIILVGLCFAFAYAIDKGLA